MRVEFWVLHGLSLPLALLYANAGEWLIHKYILHGWGRKKGTYWSFHWHEHHREVRRNDHVDPMYASPRWGSLNAFTKEFWGLLGVGVLHLPLLWVSPLFVVGVWWSVGRYFYVHRRSHLDPVWARRSLPWHMDHHLGPNQDANWCVSYPWFDWVMGTREYYIGTEREQRDQERRAARQQDKAHPIETVAQASA